MGSNTLQTKNANDVISEDDVNQYKTALGGDILPRTTGGVVTDIIGSVGSATYRFLSGYFSKIYIGSTSNNNSIEESGTSIVAKISGTVKAEIASTGILRKYFETAVVQTGDQAGNQVGTASFADITNVSVTITTNGNPVLICFQPNDDASNASSLSLASASSSGLTGNLKLLRGATTLTLADISITNNTSGNNGVECFGFTFIDDNAGAGLAAGTYTYKMQMRRTEFTVHYMALKAYEL